MALIKTNTRSLSGAITSSQVPTKTITSAALPAGTPLQIKHSHKPTATQYSSGIQKIMEVALTTLKVNSKIKIDINYHDCKPNVDNRDSHNRAYQFGYKTGSASSTVGDYTGRGGRISSNSNTESCGMQGNHADGNSPLEQSDVIAGGGLGGEWGSWGSDYEVQGHVYSFEFSPSVAAGTVLQLSFWVNADASFVASGPHYFLNANNHYNGAVSSIHATEISV